MTDKKTVIFAKATGHVLAAVTQNADPTSELKVEDVAGGGLLVRGFKPVGSTTGNERFEILPEELDVKSVDLDPVILLQPRIYSVQDGDPVQISAPAAMTPAFLGADKIRVTMTTAVTEETIVWIQVSGQTLAGPRTGVGTISSGSTVDIAFAAVDPDSYSVLTLVGGRLPDARTIPSP